MTVRTPNRDARAADPDRGRQRRREVSNALRLLADVEGESIDAHVRGANGNRWKAL